MDWESEDLSRISGLDRGEDLRLSRNADGSYGKGGSYRPGPLDSGIMGCSWHRIVIDAHTPRNTRLEIKVYTSDEPTPEMPPTDTPADTLIFKDDVRDVLVQAEPGRQIKLDIDFYGDGKETPVLRQVKVYYPRLSYLRYLPEIYQEDPRSRDFLERFLSVFESMLYDCEETITDLPLHFDPMAAPDDFLEWLASWLALGRYERLGEKNREFILRAVHFYKQKGTSAGLASLVSFLTGNECCVKEYMNNVFRSYGREHLEAEEDEGTGRCLRFFHETSTSLDTDPDRGMISDMGKYTDRVHYTFDARPDGRYSPHCVGLFIFLKPGETLPITEDEIKRIINAFLPVFIHVEITTVESF